MRHSRAGFTLIELLIVVVIIGILAAIAVPKFANAKEKAYFATMKGDLRNLANAQEAYTGDNGGLYASGTVTSPNALPDLAYGPSSGVTLQVVATPTGWSAIASMPSHSAKKCGMYVDNGDPPTVPGGGNPATNVGEPKCE
ncbi:MAG: prepilin-type N-terminal cleavage/methylation domain-containing protein [Gemmatimonadaceae bacterium]|nr:prepilin-type N-terminal cleavage/methylation domain-containing protein [Gemmatimonadaceae bacterium]